MMQPGASYTATTACGTRKALIICGNSPSRSSSASAAWVHVFAEPEGISAPLSKQRDTEGHGRQHPALAVPGR